jgi:hypothetical protein
LFSCKKNENQKNIEITNDNIELINDNTEIINDNTETGSLEIQINESINKTMYINASGGLRVRSLPSIDGERIGLLNYSTEISITREVNKNLIINGIEGKWVYIKADNIEGWVFSGYLSDRIELDQKKYEVKLQGIFVGMNSTQVCSILNNPSKIEYENYENTNLRYEYWYYDGIKLSIWDNVVIVVELISEKYATYRGIRIGDSINKLLELYPEAIEREYKGYSKTDYFYSYDFSYYISSEVYVTDVIHFHYNKNNYITDIATISSRSDEYGYSP